ncbi:4-hydroxymandelate oxidase [Streptomyces yunnanensis]|uniref:4-hydroxymandelate oxidase n=2 Tax=Streptomyces yunnanensis TaxID=156453 RepID=A0A9X8MPU7_9ACTN|nr:4-hydroxymandelate oxidase [Streptomyces yunnanensis]
MRWMDTLAHEAEQRLPAPVLTYFRQGAGAGLSAAEAEAHWDALRLLPHVLRDVSVVSTRTSVLGSEVDTPVLVAPTTLQLAAHEEGEIAMLRGAAAAGSLVCVSSNAGVPFTSLADSGPWWVQAYVLRDRQLTVELLDRARQAGAKAVVLTADTPVVGQKYSAGPSVWETVPPEHLLANVDQQGVEAAQLEKAADLTPATIDWLRTTFGLPVVVKGVLRADDARECVAAGASAVWVSNHGGRQLDGTIATAGALRPVADALAGTDAEIYVDGGIRKGRHALTALALGATAVFVGRPTLWALTVDGAAGVQRLLTELTAELAHAMALAGTPDIPSLTRDLVSG